MIKICAINIICSRLPYSLLTALPILAVASIALSACVGLVLSANDLVICDTNSTEMPTACKQHKECKFLHEMTTLMFKNQNTEHQIRHRKQNNEYRIFTQTKGVN